MLISQYFSRNLLVTGLLVAASSGIIGCANQPQLSPAQIAQIDAHDALIEDAQQFVHANLFTGMIHVWSEDRQPWNALLGAYLCGSSDETSSIVTSYEANQPIFSDAMQVLANHQARFSSDDQQAVLDDVSKLAYRLFSASYAKGYARQVTLADSLSPGIHEELCGGRIIDSPDDAIRYSSDVKWSSFSNPVLSDSNGLQAHAQNGYQAFQVLLKQQQSQFDALVYSHAYQQSDAYETLFFEVNKFENVEQYGQQLKVLSSLSNAAKKAVSNVDTKHNDFAYLVLSSGYHWGMMSVLAMLEEEYPRLHDSKRQQATEEVKAVTAKIQIPTEIPIDEQ